MRDFEFAGATAVITGAASGMGLEMARNLAARGTNLALVDRDQAGLDSVAGELGAKHPALTVTTHVVDLSVPSDFAGLVAEIEAAHTPVTLLVNNAGVALGGALADLSLEDIDWLTNVNYRAVVAMTKAFLPALTASPDSHLVNVSSLFGLIAPMGQSAYVASKFAVRGFTESIRGELLTRGIGTTVVHPGGVATNIAKNARIGSGVDPAQAERSRTAINAMLSMPASTAAAQIVRAVEKRRDRLVITGQAKALDLLSRVAPSRYIALVNRNLSRR